MIIENVKEFYSALCKETPENTDSTNTTIPKFDFEEEEETSEQEPPRRRGGCPLYLDEFDN